MNNVRAERSEQGAGGGEAGEDFLFAEEVGDGGDAGASVLAGEGGA